MKNNNLINRLRYLGNEVNIDYRFRLFKSDKGYKNFQLTQILEDRIKAIHLTSKMKMSWKNLKTKKQILNKIDNLKSNI